MKYKLTVFRRRDMLNKKFYTVLLEASFVDLLGFYYLNILKKEVFVKK